MKALTNISLISLLLFAVGCGDRDAEPQEEAPSAETPAAVPDTGAPDAGEPGDAASVEIVPGLSRRILEAGDGATAQQGQTAVVHYTGWLYDPSAPDHHGQKFDSSRDRGQHFEFPLGAGRVIRGWDQGVVGMEIGEVRELTIAPELAYGERGAGDVIPANATLVFEVELVDLKTGS